MANIDRVVQDSCQEGADVVLLITTAYQDWEFEGIKTKGVLELFHELNRIIRPSEHSPLVSNLFFLFIPQEIEDLDLQAPSVICRGERSK